MLLMLMVDWHWCRQCFLFRDLSMSWELMPLIPMLVVPLLLLGFAQLLRTFSLELDTSTSPQGRQSCSASDLPLKSTGGKRVPEPKIALDRIWQGLQSFDMCGSDCRGESSTTCRILRGSSSDSDLETGTRVSETFDYMITLPRNRREHLPATKQGQHKEKYQVVEFIYVELPHSNECAG